MAILKLRRIRPRQDHITDKDASSSERFEDGLHFGSKSLNGRLDRAILNSSSLDCWFDSFSASTSTFKITRSSSYLKRRSDLEESRQRRESVRGSLERFIGDEASISSFTSYGSSLNSSVSSGCSATGSTREVRNRKQRINSKSKNSGFSSSPSSWLNKRNLNTTAPCFRPNFYARLPDEHEQDNVPHFEPETNVSTEEVEESKEVDTESQVSLTLSNLDLQESRDSNHEKDDVSFGIDELYGGDDVEVSLSQPPSPTTVQMVPAYGAPEVGGLNQHDSVDLSNLISHMQVVQNLENLMKNQISFGVRLPKRQQRTQVRWNVLEATLSGDMAAKAFLKSNYRLGDEDLDVITSHLSLCQELNKEVSWDLIFRIILPDADVNWDQVQRVVNPVDMLVSTVLEADEENHDDDSLPFDSYHTTISDNVEDVLNRIVCNRPSKAQRRNSLFSYCSQQDVKHSSSAKLIEDLEGLLEKESCNSKGFQILQDLLSVARRIDDETGYDVKTQLSLDDIQDITSHLQQHEESNTPIRWDLIEMALEMMIIPDDVSDISEA